MAWNLSNFWRQNKEIIMEFLKKGLFKVIVPLNNSRNNRLRSFPSISLFLKVSYVFPP